VVVVVVVVGWLQGGCGFSLVVVVVGW